MNIERISRTEMAARFKQHRRRLVGGSLAEAVRGCECYAVGDRAALAIEFEAPKSAFITLAVSQEPRSMLDDFEAAASQLCQGRSTGFHTRRRGLVLAAQRRGWKRINISDEIWSLRKDF
jgi:hypothetical protein